MMMVLIPMPMIMLMVEMQPVGAAPFHLGVHLLDGGVAHFDDFATHEKTMTSQGMLVFGTWHPEGFLGWDGEDERVARLQASKGIGEAFHDAAYAKHHHARLFGGGLFKNLAVGVVGLDGVNQLCDFQIIDFHGLLG